MSENFLIPFTEGTRRLKRALKKEKKRALDEGVLLSWHQETNTNSGTPPTPSAFYLVCLGQLMKYPSINGSSHEVVSSSDGVDVTSEVEVKLQKIGSHSSL